jgi:hypothetical protein
MHELVCCLPVGLPAGAWRIDGARTEKAHQASVGFLKRSNWIRTCSQRQRETIQSSKASSIKELCP